MRITAVAATLFLLGGCAVQKIGPEVSEYRLRPLQVERHASHDACRDKTMQVSLTLAPDLFKSLQIHYADADFTHYTYTRSRWAESPDRQLRHLFESALEQSGLYKSVITYDSQAYNDLYFEPKINDFMQYFDDDGSSWVHLDMELMVMDQDTARVISNLHVEKRVPTESSDALGAVKAFNALVHETLNETIGWLDDVCERQSIPEEKRGQ
jgi:cholesterol transport system auxiliary component